MRAAVCVLLVLVAAGASATRAEPHGDLLPFATTAPAPLAPTCADTDAFHVLLVIPPATPDLRDARLPLVRAGVGAADAVVRESALPHGHDARLRFLCDAEGALRVDVVRTRTPNLAASFSTIVAELQAQGFDRADRKYWVVYDGYVPCGGCIGQANVHADDRPTPDNANNGGRMYALTYLAAMGVSAPAGTLANVMLHEAGHTLGAVQLSAPHSTGAWHCNDGADTMCYADAGPASRHDARACPRLLVTHVGPEMPFDCGNDDYFHPAPPVGSHLATRWNVASSRYVEVRAASQATSMTS